MKMILSGKKVFRTGNSLAVTIPVGFTTSLGIRSGDSVEVKEYRERARIVYRFSGPKQMSFDEVFLRRGKVVAKVKR